MSHLPGAHHEEDGGLSQGPPEHLKVKSKEIFLSKYCHSPQHSLVCALAGLPEALLPVALVVLLLGDLLHLVQQLPHSQLQLGQFLLLGHVGVVNGVLTDLHRQVLVALYTETALSTHLDVQMNPELGPAEPLGAVAVQADHVLPGHVGGEGELALAAVHLETMFLIHIYMQLSSS